MSDTPKRQTIRAPKDVSTAQWLAGYLAAWLVMLAAILALDTISADRPFVVLAAAIWLLAFPASFILRRLTVPRAAVNFPIVLLCFASGIPLVGGRLGIRVSAMGVDQALLRLSDTSALEFLIRAFVWIMVFRAFAIRTYRDLTLCVVPSISALVLTVIVQPDLRMLIFLCALLLGGVYLLAADQRMAAAERADFVLTPGGTSTVPGPAPRSAWFGIYLGTLLCGAVLCLLLTRITIATDITRSIKIQAARRLAGFIIRRTHVPYGGAAGGIYVRGPAPQLSDAVMFTVRATHEANWRLSAYDVFQGHSWRRRAGFLGGSGQGRKWGELEPWEIEPGASSGNGEPSSGVGAPNAPGLLLEQRVTLMQTFQGAIVAAYRPVSYRGPGRRVRTDEYGALVTNSTFDRGTTYLVRSLTPMPRRASENAPGHASLSRVAKRTCLQLPPDMPRSIIELAHDLTDDENDAYRKAMQIERCLGDNYTYDDDVGATPRGRGFVEFFLFESKRGYCLHFATAMAVMCRAVGIPARLAVGYSPGDYDADRDEYVVRERHTHAWPEIYLDGVGWVAFDPTQTAADMQLTGMALIYHNASAWWQRIVQRVPLLNVQPPPRRLVSFLAIALASLAGGAQLMRRVGRSKSPGAHRALLSHPPSRRLVRAYWAMCHRAARRGLRRERSQTPFEFARLVTGAVPQAGELIWWLTKEYARLVFGEHRPTDRIARLAQARSRRAIALLRRVQVAPPSVGTTQDRATGQTETEGQHDT